MKFFVSYNIGVCVCVCVCVALLEELVNSGRVRGSIVGGRQDKAVFVPDVYCRAQNAWIESFLTHNSYLGNTKGLDLQIRSLHESI